MHLKRPAILTDRRAFFAYRSSKIGGPVLAAQDDARHFAAPNRAAGWPAALRRPLFAPGKFHLPGPLLTNAGPYSLLQGSTEAFAACGDRKTAKHRWKGNF